MRWICLKSYILLQLQVRWKSSLERNKPWIFPKLLQSIKLKLFLSHQPETVAVYSFSSSFTWREAISGESIGLQVEKISSPKEHLSTLCRHYQKLFLNAMHLKSRNLNYFEINDGDFKIKVITISFITTANRLSERMKYNNSLICVINNN